MSETIIINPPIKKVALLPLNELNRKKNKKNRQKGMKEATKARQEKIPVGSKWKVNTRWTGTEVTQMQTNFIKYLLDDPKMNATEAATKAGYKNPAETGAMLLRNPRVQSVLMRILGPVMKKLEITAEKTLEHIASIAYCNMLDYLEIDEFGVARVNLKDLDRHSAFAIQELITEEVIENSKDSVVPIKVRRIRFKLHDKLQALGMLTKIQKLAPEGEQDKNQPITMAMLDSIIKTVDRQLETENQKQLTNGHVIDGNANSTEVRVQ